MGNKPKIADILGVEVNEKFWITGDYGTEIGPWIVNEKGNMIWVNGPRVCNPEITCTAVNHPERVVKKDEPKLTENELKICKDLGAYWVALNVRVSFVKLYNTEPEKDVSGNWVANENESFIAMVDKKLFPSVREGQLVKAKWE